MLSLLWGNKGKRGEIKIICRNEVRAALLLACVPAPGVSSRVSMALNGTLNTFLQVLSGVAVPAMPGQLWVAARGLS